MRTLTRTPGSTNVVRVPNRTWRQRVEAENKRQRGLQAELLASAKRRAVALEEGVAELGSKAAVAREIGVSTTAVRTAIRDYGSAASEPRPTTE